MPRVPLTNFNYTVSVPHNKICKVGVPLRMPRQHFVQLDDLKV